MKASNKLAKSFVSRKISIPIKEKHMIETTKSAMKPRRSGINCNIIWNWLPEISRNRSCITAFTQKRAPIMKSSMFSKTGEAI